MRIFTILFTCSVLLISNTPSKAERLEHRNLMYPNWEEYNALGYFAKLFDNHRWSLKTQQGMERFFGMCHSTNRTVNYERARLHYNDRFHEIQSDDQAKDIQNLADIQQNSPLKNWPSFYQRDKEQVFKNSTVYKEPCDQLIKVAYQYDRKWYAHERARKKEQNKKNKETWIRQFVPNNDDKFDTIMNGHNIHIPHKYVSPHLRRRDDPKNVDISVIFTLADVLDESELEPEMQDYVIRGVVTPIESRGTPFNSVRKCPEENIDQRYCKRNRLHMRIAKRYMHCVSDLPNEFEVYAEFWQKRNCTFHDSVKKRYPDLNDMYDQNLDLFRFSNSSFIGGTLEFPEYRFWCRGQKNKFCTSEIGVKQGIGIRYTIPMQALPYHRKIHQSISDILSSFIGDKLNPGQ